MNAGTVVAEAAVVRLTDATERLGVFTAEQLAQVTGNAVAAAERFLSDRPAHFEWMEGTATRTGRWRIREGAPAPEKLSAPAPAPVHQKARAADLADQADAALKGLERGFVQDLGARAAALELAEHRIGLAALVLDPDDRPPLRRRLARSRRRVAALRDAEDATGPYLVQRLSDWTERVTPELSPPGRETGAFDLQTALSRAAARAAAPNAASGPALALVAARLADADKRQALTVELDHSIRKQALAGDPFKVLALSLVAAVTGAAGLADALVSAITTPAFRSAADRGTMRAAYTALANLARPGGDDPEAASAACVYLMQRERPGPDEMELLAPAALQTAGADSESAIKLIARWLAWERDRCVQDRRLLRLSHVSRNLGCSLHVVGFEPLDRGLHTIANDDAGVVLVECLADEEHDSLLLHLMHPEPSSPDAPPEDILGQPPDENALEAARRFGAQARERVAEVTDPRRERSLPTYFALPPGCTVAEAIAKMHVTRRRRRPGVFTKGLEGDGDGTG